MQKLHLAGGIGEFPSAHGNDRFTECFIQFCVGLFLDVAYNYAFQGTQRIGTRLRTGTGRMFRSGKAAQAAAKSLTPVRS
jgi:hypothetical protein